jgi:hypothetical protein
MPPSARWSRRSRPRTSRSTGETSSSCCSSAPAPSKPKANRGRCVRAPRNAISINGARPTSNNYLLDGTSNTDTALGTPSAIISVDAIQEFKEQTGTYSAEYGYSANQINVVTKTGTNKPHGSVFLFRRDDALDSKAPFDVTKQKLNQDQFGFVLGGPMLIPGLYDGRNRTFFLVNYEGSRRTQGQQNFYTVPTPAQLSGQFSTPIIDPTTGQPFPGNVIPAGRFSRLANLARSKFWPAPNTSSALGNYVASRDLPTDSNQFTIRIDQQLGAGAPSSDAIRAPTTRTPRGARTAPIGDNFFVGGRGTGRSRTRCR